LKEMLVTQPLSVENLFQVSQIEMKETDGGKTDQNQKYRWIYRLQKESKREEKEVANLAVLGWGMESVTKQQQKSMQFFARDREAER
jgi:hypothetical protein